MCAESEMELAFAALHQLCAPMLDRLDRIPAPHRDALEVVLRPMRRNNSQSVYGGAGRAEVAD